MPITTAPAFESIALDALGTVTGGCKKSAPPPTPEQPMQESAPQISTNVSITGYGAPVQTTA